MTPTDTTENSRTQDAYKASIVYFRGLVGLGNLGRVTVEPMNVQFVDLETL